MAQSEALDTDVEPQPGVLAARLARLIDTSQAVRDVAVEVGVVDREWLAKPLRRRPSIASPLEVMRRFVERLVDRHPSTLASVGLNALELLSWDVFWDRRVGLRPARDTVSHAAVVFTDLEGFTRFTAVRGDEAARALLVDHHARAAPIVRKRGGRIVKSLGDGLMLVFPDEHSAIRTAVDLLDTAPAPLRLRAGVHAGELMVTADDLIGHVVNVTARVAGAARGGHVLATRSAVEAAGEMPDVRVLRSRRRALKGVHEKVAVARVEARRDLAVESA